MRVRGNLKGQVVRLGARLDAGTSSGERARLHEAVASGVAWCCVRCHRGSCEFWR
jgi:hypothetical protein